jgi:hypothetical protein
LQLAAQLRLSWVQSAPSLIQTISKSLTILVATLACEEISCSISRSSKLFPEYLIGFLGLLALRLIGVIKGLDLEGNLRPILLVLSFLPFAAEFAAFSLVSSISVLEEGGNMVFAPLTRHDNGSRCELTGSGSRRPTDGAPPSTWWPSMAS